MDVFVRMVDILIFSLSMGVHKHTHFVVEGTVGGQQDLTFLYIHSLAFGVNSIPQFCHHLLCLRVSYLLESVTSVAHVFRHILIQLSHFGLEHSTFFKIFANKHLLSTYEFHNSVDRKILNLTNEH